MDYADPYKTVIEEPTGKPTETRIANACSARSLVSSLVWEDTERARRRTLVKGCIDGNAPYINETLKNAGLAWMTNLNLMEGKALMDSSGIPYYSLFTGAEPYVEANTDFLPDHPDHNLWCGQIALRLHQMIKRWQQFDWHLQQASFWMRLHGIGPIIWERDDDWRFRAVETGAMLAPKNSPSCIDNRVPYVIVRIRYRAHELYDFIRDEKAAEEQGWDVEAVKTALKNAYRGDNGSPYQGISWEEIQRQFKNDDLTTGYTKCDEIAAAHLYVNEYSGAVSHFIITESPLLAESFGPDMSERFLYRHVGRYEKLEHVVAVFFQDIGDGTWHSVRGLADLAFKHLEVLNRLDCRMIDGAFIDGGIILQPEGQRDFDKVQSVQWGPFTLLPANLKIQNARVSGQLEGTMAVSRVVRNGLGNNIGMFNQRSVAREDGRGEAVTATQINAQVAKESTLSQGQMALTYRTADAIYNNILRIAKNFSTMDTEALRFQKECEQDGVPKEALEGAWVRANRAAGFGSPQMANMVLDQLMPVVGMLPEDGKKSFLDMKIQSTVGAEKVRILNPPHHIAGDDEWAAGVENSLFAQGLDAELTSGQNDVIHAQVHIAFAKERLEPVNQAAAMGQADEESLSKAMQFMVPFDRNMTAHLARMKTDPARKQLVPMFEAQLKDLSSISADINRALLDVQRDARIAAQQQQNATALDAETQAKLRASQADILLSAQETQAKIVDNRAKTIAKVQDQHMKTQAKIAQDRAAAAAKNGNGEGE